MGGRGQSQSLDILAKFKYVTMKIINGNKYVIISTNILAFGGVEIGKASLTFFIITNVNNPINDDTHEIIIRIQLFVFIVSPLMPTILRFAIWDDSYFCMMTINW